MIPTRPSPYLATQGVTINTGNTWICPDVLSIESLGPADGWRGRVIRGFFWVMKRVTGV